MPGTLKEIFMSPIREARPAKQHARSLCSNNYTAMAKRALVLSSGGLFGAYQAGAWSALDAHFQPDLIIGASIGALNSWCIAGGASGHEICQRWRHLQLESITRARHPIEELFQEYHPRTSVSVVLTDILRLRIRAFSNQQITSRHLAASCAIPLVLPMQRIDRIWYADGGLLGSLPINAAIEQGATEIFAINVWAPLPWLWSNCGRTLRLLTGNRIKAPKNVKIHLLTPPRLLGRVSDAYVPRPGNIERWIAQGHADATKHFPPGMF